MARPLPPTDSQVRLHVVTGKGGTGKTTVAAALALSLAREGKRVLVAEVEGRQGLAQAYGVDPPAGLEESLAAETDEGGVVRLLDVDPRDALLEYLRTKVPVGPAASVLTRLGAVDFATTIAPGVRDVLLLGKVYEAIGRTTEGRVRRPVYDAVVLDAPPTGRVGRFLSAPTEIAALAQVGPIRRQADAISRVLHGPATLVHVVMLLEEMPVQESVEAVADLGRRSLSLGSVVVNRVEPDLLGGTRPIELDGDLAERTLAQALRSQGICAPTAPLLQQARDHASGAGARATLLGEVRSIGQPVIPLRLLPGGVAPRDLAELATDLGAVR